MLLKEQIVEVKDYVTKSNLPASDYVINPYVGCAICFCQPSEPIALQSVIRERGKKNEETE